MEAEKWINRGNNLLATAIVALAGFAFLPEVFLETEMHYKVDDLFLFILGIISIWWYKTGENRYKRSVVPVAIVLLSLATKVVAVAIEMKDKEDVGDDFGALILFVLVSFLVLWVFKSAKKIAR